MIEYKTETELDLDRLIELYRHVGFTHMPTA